MPSAFGEASAAFEVIRECIVDISELSFLTDGISRDLSKSACSYYRIGIEQFHESRSKSWVDFQPAVGNLAISVELLLKSIVARKAISQLYTNLPEEAKLLLNYPESFAGGHNSMAIASDLRAFAYKTIELDKCVALFWLFYPDSKQEYKQFFFSLSAIRNVSVHASIPDLRKYELERLAHYSTKLFVFVKESRIHPFFFFLSDDTTDAFMDQYRDDKVKKVKKAIQEAMDVVKKGELADSSALTDDWDSMVTTCPVCDSDAIVSGETEEGAGENELTLWFQPASFRCDSCGLVLEDYDELGYAGLRESLERVGDVDRWIGERYEYESWYMLRSTSTFWFLKPGKQEGKRPGVRDLPRPDPPEREYSVLRQRAGGSHRTEGLKDGKVKAISLWKPWAAFIRTGAKTWKPGLGRHRAVASR